jgi:hypothetical protein
MVSLLAICLHLLTILLPIESFPEVNFKLAISFWSLLSGVNERLAGYDFFEHSIESG